MHYFKLRNGVDIPCVMLGTYHSGYKSLPQAVNAAISLNEYGIDTAQDYNNESLLGKLFFKERRDDLFITTKISYSKQIAGSIEKELLGSLQNLNVDVLDLLLLHWPSPSSLIFLKSWEQMLNIYTSGKVRAIGIANCAIKHLKLIQREFGENTDVLPHVIQNENHPFHSLGGIYDFCCNNDIIIESYAATCNMLPFVIQNPTLKALAHKYTKTIPQIICRWNFQLGMIPIIHSFNPVHIKDNINYFDFSLEEDEMKAITGLNMNYKCYPESLFCPGY